MNVFCRIMSFLLITLIGLSAFSAVDDQILIFSTPGVDHYADGSVVRDGEFYAVVCAPNAGKNDFYGFTSLGTMVDPENNTLVCRLPVAKDGRCPRTTLVVPKEMISGRVHIVMMDTRLPTTGLPGPGNVVRGYAVASSGAADSYVSAKGLSGAAGGLWAVGAELPAEVPQPVISDLSFQDGFAVLRVVNTVPGVYYSVIHDGRMERLRERAPVIDAYARTDDGTGAVRFAVPLKTGESGFFQIKVAPFKSEGASP